MSCLLDKDMQKSLFKLIASNLFHKSYKTGEDGKFSLDMFIKEIYDFVLESSENPALALDAARLVPQNMTLYLTLKKEVAEQLKKDNKNIRMEILQKEEDFAENIENVRTTLGLNTSVEDALDAAQEFIDSPVSEEPVVPIPAEQEIKAAEWWNTLPLGAFVTYGSELKESGKEDPANKFNANAIRDIANQLKEKGLSDSSQLDQPLFLKIMPAGEANIKIGRLQYASDKGMMAVLVNKKGDLVKMTFAGETKAVYFKLYSPVPLITKNGKKVIDLNKSSFINFVKNTSELSTVGPTIDKKTNKVIFTADQNRTSMANSLYKKIKTTYDNLTRQYLEADKSEKEAEALALEELSKDFEIFENMREYVENQGKSADAVITGALLGFVIVDQYNPVPLKQIFGDQAFEPVSVKKDEIGINLKTGGAYFNYPGINKPITINKPSLVEMPELMESIISLFTDPLKDNKGNPISVATRNKLIQQFILKDYTKVGFVPTKEGTGFVFKDGTSKIMINDEYMSFTYDEKDIDARKKIADALRAVFNKPFQGAQLPIDSDIIRNYNLNVITELSGPVEPNTVLLKDNKYYQINMKYVEVVGNYINKAFEMPNISNGVLTTEPKIYNDFIRDNFGANVRVDANNKIQAYNPTLTYAPTLESFAKFSASPEVEKEIEKSQEPVEEKPQSDAPATQEGLSFDDIGAGLVIEKNLSQKMRNEKAREEFTKAAKEWYENSPIFKDPKTGETRFPFEIVSKAVNDGQGPVAQWAIHGIRLFHYYSADGKFNADKSGDFTDLYHEAWHAFTQTFLTPTQRKDLYREARKRPGSFQDYEGTYVTFADADVWQLEEFLAEEFRDYMMSGGKKVIKGSPATRSIFKKILDFLKALFDKVNPIDIVKDPMTHGPIAEMYENLRMGNLSSYNFSLDNRDKTIGVLNSLQARDNNTEKKISIQDANMLVGSIDSIISQFATAVTEARGGDRTYITQLMSTTEGKKAVYRKALETLISRKNSLQEEHDKLSIDDPISSYKRNELRQIIELLDWATGPNFGDIETLANNKDNKGLIAYHAAKSRYLSEEDKESLFEEDELDETKQNEEARGQGFDRSGNEVSQYDLASPEIKYLLRSILKYDEKGLPVKNIIGIQELADTHVVWNKIARTLNGVMDMEQMWKELDLAAHNRDASGNIVRVIDPTLSNLLRKLGDVNLQTDANAALWIKFWGTFNMVSIPLIQMTVEKTTKQNGEISTKMTVGQTASSSRRTINLWKNAFRGLNSDFIIRDLQEATPDGKVNVGFNKNYLDVDAVIKAYSDSKNNLKDAPNFLRAIGVRISDKESINTAVNNNVGNTKIIFNKLKTLSEKNIKRLYSLDEIFNEYEDLGLASDQANLTALGNLENKYSDYTSNYAQTNAEGNTQYELSLHNSMSIMVHTINAAPDYKSLIKDNPHMAYLDIKTNPFVKSSSWLNSIFEIRDALGELIPETDPRFGKRRMKDGVPVKLNMSNLSGVQMVKDNVSDGISSAGADEFTKMIMDFHMNLKGRPELMRHADKGTSFSVWLQNIEGGPKEGGYVSTVSFFADDQGNIDGYSSATKMMMRYLEAEMTRVSKMRDLQEKIKNQKTEGEIIYDAAYVKEGQKFLIFEDILNKETRESLIKIKDFNKISQSMKDKIGGEIEEYFINQFEKVKKVFERHAFIDPTLANTLRIQAAKEGKITGSLGSSQSLATSDKRKLTLTEDAMVRSFVVNNWIHNIESMNILYSDIAQYNMKKEDFHKRNAGGGSTGNLLSTSRPVINYINSKGRKYAASLKDPSIKEKQLATDGSIQTAVLADNEIPSAYFAEIREAIVERETEKNNAIKDPSKRLSEKELEKKIDQAVDAYTNMTEGDGQGWITFDFYRAASIAEGKWTSVQEKLYNDVVSGKSISKKDAIEFFPTKKYQYWGPVEYRKNENGQFVRDEKNELMTTTAFHKFSLFPLIPNVIEGTNLEKLHIKMMKQGIDYALFQSGSKISTLSKIKTNGEKDADKFYTKERDFDQDSDFTPNTIYMQFLKNQLEIAPHFKEEVTFPTQMRKLIENGIMEGGVPTDFAVGLPIDERKRQWDALDLAGKLNKSDYFKLVKNYENDLTNLMLVKKEKLIKEANIKFKTIDGKRVAQIDNQLIKFIQNELTRQELGDHEIAFLKTKDGGEGIAHDLSISLSSEKLEKILNSIVVKRLVKQKFKGEGLIQVSGAGWETNLRGKLTDEEKLKYGTNELPFYTREVVSVGKDGKKVYGKTKAMKVKIAMQGDFYNLYELIHNDGKKIGDIKRLNEMLKDEEWLNKGNHRDMVSITGPRIPTQENNSMEFAEVYEFLDELAGNIVVLPSEIVAKSGGDFDIDKITFMFSNISAKPDVKNVDFKVFAEKYGKTEQEIKNIFDQRKNKDKTEEDKTILDDIYNFYPKKVTLPLDSNTEEGLENRILRDMREILALKDNYVSLVRPNGTDLIKPLADDLADKVMEYNPKDRFRGDKSNVIAGTRIFEIQYNLYKHSSNNIGKATLGIGAVDNTYNTVYNRIGMHMNKSYVTRGGVERELRILLPHNKITNKDGEEVISLSNLYDATGENSISSVIAQLINGWVDIAKDAWIFNIQGNKEISPTLLFMIQAGVPIDQAVYMVSHPLVRQYVEEQKLAKTLFAESLGKGDKNPMYFRNAARKEIFKKLFDADVIQKLSGKAKDKDTELKRLTDYYVNNSEADFSTDALSKEDLAGLKPEDLAKWQGKMKVSKNLYDRIDKKENWDDTDKAVFLHFIELEEMSKVITKIKSNTNFDTNPSLNLFEAQRKINMLAELKDEQMIPTEMINKIVENSPISSFYVQDFQIELWQDLFKLRNNDKLNDFILQKLDDFNEFNDAKDATFGDSEKIINEFRNDLPSFIFQNSLREFDLNAKFYKGLEISDTGTEIKQVSNLRHGVFVKNGIIYVNKEQVKKDYEAIQLSKFDYKITLEDGTLLSVAPVKKADFPTPETYYSFIFEREVLRNRWKNKFDILAERADTKAKIKFYESSMAKEEKETNEHFQARLKTVVFEEMIRDMALDNTFNQSKIFRSNESMADQLTQIQVLYPELSSRYSLLNALSANYLETGVEKLANIMMNDSMIDDPEKINIFHQNLLELSNPGKIKINTESTIERERVADFFNRLTVFAFLQSGMNTKGMYSLIRLVPQEKFTDLMTIYSANFLDKINDITLERYWQKFIEVNKNRRTRTRMRDYTIRGYNLDEDFNLSGMGQASAKDAKKVLKPKEAEIKKESAVTFETDSQGNKIYDATGIGFASANKAIQENPDVIFAINGVKLDPNQKMPGGADKNEAALFGASKGAAAVGLPTRAGFGLMKTDQLVDADVDPNGKTPVQQTEPSKQLAPVLEAGRYVKFNGQDFIVIKQNQNGTWQIYNPLLEGVQAKKSVSAVNMKLTPNKGEIVSYKDAEYIVTPKGTIISLTTNKKMNWDENNGDRKAILGLITGSTQPQAPVSTTLPGPETKINIYYSRGDNKDLSNFAARKFTYQGREYQSVEHAYQTLKSGSFDQSAYDRPGDFVGQKRNAPKGVQQSTSLELMKNLIRASFEQNPGASQALLNTGNAQITHIGGTDKFWETQFPKLLMQVREELRPAGATPTGGGVASTGKTETGDDTKTIRPINSTVINPVLKQQIDSAISTLKDYQAQGKTIAFPKAGFGQYMIGADDLTGELKDNKIVPIAPQAFVYLSQQLWENFKFVNPNFDTALGFVKMPNVLQANAEVTDEDVLNALSFCFNA